MPKFLSAPGALHVVAFGWLVSSVVTSAQSTGAEKPRLSGTRPNILFILADDLSYQDLSWYGQTRFQTPSLDRLAREGLVFPHAYSGAPECAPSRASVMTGMHMGHCRVRLNASARGSQEHLLDEDVTVAEVLQGAGYATGYIGKWGAGLLESEGAPHRQGFDLAFGFYDQRRAHTYYPDFLVRNGTKIPLPQNYGFNMKRVYEYNRKPIDQLAGLENTYTPEGRLVADGVADPSRVVNSEAMFQEEALKFIREHARSPFFLYYATQIPHGPTISPDLGPLAGLDWPSLKHKEWAAMIQHLDHGVGRMVALLEELEIRENTVIFFASDNGYAHWGYFGRKRYLDDPFFQNKGPFRGGKFICQEGGVRVPFFANWPGKIRAGRSDHICALYDFLATAADLAGAHDVPPTDGLSLVAELGGQPELQPKHEALYWENGGHNQHAQSVRMGPWHAYRPHPDKPTELFRIEDDPACEHDLAAQHPEIVRKVEAIFVREHTDSQWFRNPGETNAEYKAKREKAEALGQTWESRQPNMSQEERP